MSRYPEHEKLRAMKVKSQAIGEFIEWLETQDWEICRLDVGTNYNERIPVNLSVEKVLALYFEIDLKRIEDERRAMIEEHINRSAYSIVAPETEPDE